MQPGMMQFMDPSQMQMVPTPMGMQMMPQQQQFRGQQMQGGGGQQQGGGGGKGPSTRTCWEFEAKGSCSRGDQCRYMHVKGGAAQGQSGQGKGPYQYTGQAAGQDTEKIVGVKRDKPQQVVDFNGKKIGFSDIEHDTERSAYCWLIDEKWVIRSYSHKVTYPDGEENVLMQNSTSAACVRHLMTRVAAFCHPLTKDATGKHIGEKKAAENLEWFIGTMMKRGYVEVEYPKFGNSQSAKVQDGIKGLRSIVKDLAVTTNKPICDLAKLSKPREASAANHKRRARDGWTDK